MRVKLVAHNRQVRKKVEQDLYWYDAQLKQMNIYKGTRLSFVYDRINRKVVPCPVVEEIPVYRNSWEDISAVLSENAGKIVINESRPRFSVTFDVNDDDFWYVLEKQLRKLDIRYEIEDIERIRTLADKYNINEETVADLASRYGIANVEKHCKSRKR